MQCIVALKTFGNYGLKVLDSIYLPGISASSSGTHANLLIRLLNTETDLEKNNNCLQIDHMLNDVILCLLLQLPECIAYSLSYNRIKLLVYWQSILHFRGFLIDFQGFLVNGVLGMF